MGAQLPRLAEPKTRQTLISKWSGYNHNERIPGGALFDTQNLTSDLYPLMTVRNRRGRVRVLEDAHGLCSLNGLAWVDGGSLYYRGEIVPNLTLASGDKQFVCMGAYICIFPDKVVYNTANGDVSYIDADNLVEWDEDNQSGGIKVRLTRVDGLDYDNISVGESAPENPANGQFWLDTSGGEQILRVYNEIYGAWQSVSSSYIRIAGDGISDNINEMDTVTLTETVAEGDEPHEFLNGSYTVYKTGTTADGDPYIVIPGIWHNGTSVYEDIHVTLRVERKMPDVDYVCEHENRLWACSSANHEIYCSALGSPWNWNRFLGVSTDSYAATVGSAGDFTGIASHGGYVLFFKEDKIHKMYGSYPAKFQLTDLNCRGVDAGSAGSICSVNGMLFYKTPQDISALSSSSPTSVSEPLGKTKYRYANAGAFESKYYVSMQDDNGDGIFLCLDTEKGVWYREDGTVARYFANDGGDLYFLDGNTIVSVNGTLDPLYADEAASVEDRVEWYAQTGDIGIDFDERNNISEHKYIGKVVLRIEVEEETHIRLEAQYDRDTEWHNKGHINGTRKRTVLMPVVPPRCDSMRIRICGDGPFKLQSMTYTTEWGSEI